MLSSIVAFLAMLNPFALFLYLEPLRKNLNNKDFVKVLLKASIISFLICAFFFFAGDFIFQKIFQIHFESFRIFGGIIIFSIAYLFIIQGKEAFIMIKEDLDHLASEIALPLMVGAGTISLSILLAKDFPNVIGITTLTIIFILNFLIIFSLDLLRERILKKKFRIAFDKNMGILLRLNGFFLGAIGINMIITGIRNLFFTA